MAGRNYIGHNYIGNTKMWDGERLPSCLAVARSIGDRPLKTPVPVMSSEPDIIQRELTGQDDWVILGCDGVWDTLSDQEAVSIASSHFGSPKAAAEAICKMAHRKGSTDNITCVCIGLSWADPNVWGVVAST